MPVARYAKRLLTALLLLLSVVPSAHAHGAGLIMLVAVVYTPLHFAPFLCLFFLTGMKGRYGMAFGAYSVAFILSWWAQAQSWYLPFSDHLYEFLGIGPFRILQPNAISDVLILCCGWLIIIYLALRNWREPIRLRLPAPLPNLVIGGLVAVIGAGVWALGFNAPNYFPVIKTLGYASQLILFLFWGFVFPILLFAGASYVFRARFFRDNARRP